MKTVNTNTLWIINVFLSMVLSLVPSIANAELINLSTRTVQEIEDTDGLVYSEAKNEVVVVKCVAPLVYSQGECVNNHIDNQPKINTNMLPETDEDINEPHDEDDPDAWYNQPAINTCEKQIIQLEKERNHFAALVRTLATDSIQNQRRGRDYNAYTSALGKYVDAHMRVRAMQGLTSNLYPEGITCLGKPYRSMI